MQNTKYTQYFGANYEASKDELFAIYTRYQKELGSVFHQRIVDHAILDSGITLTVYEAVSYTHLYGIYSETI